MQKAKTARPDPAAISQIKDRCRLPDRLFRLNIRKCRIFERCSRTDIRCNGRWKCSRNNRNTTALKRRCRYCMGFRRRKPTPSCCRHRIPTRYCTKQSTRSRWCCNIRYKMCYIPNPLPPPSWSRYRLRRRKSEGRKIYEYREDGLYNHRRYKSCHTYSHLYLAYTCKN